jgi:hypothetical protein
VLFEVNTVRAKQTNITGNIFDSSFKILVAQEFSALFGNPKIHSCLQDPAARSDPEPIKSNPYSPFIFTGVLK